jgi:hypothetical protein
LHDGGSLGDSVHAWQRKCYGSQGFLAHASSTLLTKEEALKVITTTFRLRPDVFHDLALSASMFQA